MKLEEENIRGQRKENIGKENKKAVLDLEILLLGRIKINS